MLIIVRWGRYLIERFALPFFLPSALLHTLFLLHYTSGQTSWTDWQRILIGTVTYLGVFLILRLLDELKDKAHDDQYYPERPVQRGLVNLAEVRRALLIVISIVIIINILVFSWLSWAVLLAVGGYMTLMRYEFFIPRILRPRILLYLITHQLFVPIFLCYYFTLAGHLPHTPSDVGFLLANLGMLMSVEVARKIRPRKNENGSRDTYSAALGRGRSVLFLNGLLLATFLLLMNLQLVSGSFWWLLGLPVASSVWYYGSDRRLASHAVVGSTTLLIAWFMILGL